MIFQLFAANVPVSERSRAFGYLIAAGTIGQTFSALVTPHIYWSWMFYKFGTSGILWTYFWFNFYYRSFDESRNKLNIIAGTSGTLLDKSTVGSCGSMNISETDIPLILNIMNSEEEINSNNNNTNNRRLNNWIRFISNWPLWAIYIAHFAMNWSNYIIMQWFPYYMSRYLGADSRSLSLTAMPYIFNSFAGVGKFDVDDYDYDTYHLIFHPLKCSRWPYCRQFNQ